MVLDFTRRACKMVVSPPLNFQGLCAMKSILIACAAALLFAPVCRAVDLDKERADKKLQADERKRKYEALKKELEAFKPAPDAER